MQKHLMLVDVVGLSPYMLGDDTPHLKRLAERGDARPLRGAFPALTTSAQSAMLTGKPAQEHGIVGNGWYFKELAEVGFWKQANQLVQSDKVWHELKRRNPGFTVSKLFWWYNMYADVDYSVTPRPHYLADGGKIFDLYSSPRGLHQKIEEKIGRFPFFNFWGPKANIESSRWIVSAAIEEWQMHTPNLQLIYLPHLDYCLQKFGPQHASIAAELRAIDTEFGRLLNFADDNNIEIVVVSEYGIQPVERCVHINRALREQDFIRVRKTGEFENLDCGASDAFAVADHQIAHIYINNAERQTELRALLEATPGIEQVLDKQQQTAWRIAHERSGDFVVIAEADTWFSYYFWLDDALAPDYARTVDIHRKPGYDPVEMFLDPTLTWPVVSVGWRLFKKKLGLRTLMDVIPLDASLIKGSHGRLPEDPEQGAILITPWQPSSATTAMTDIYSLLISRFS